MRRCSPAVPKNRVRRYTSWTKNSIGARSSRRRRCGSNLAIHPTRLRHGFWKRNIDCCRRWFWNSLGGLDDNEYGGQKQKRRSRDDGGGPKKKGRATRARVLPLTAHRS